MVGRASALALLLWTAGSSSGVARADVWSYQDASGVLHFTNITPPQGKGHGKEPRWRVISRSGPGKAQTVSAALGSAAEAPAPQPEVALSGSAGCRGSRVDPVPAQDRSPERFSRYDAYIQEAAALFALPEALIRAIIKAESDYDPRVVSCAGARGLMQLMPEVEREQRVRDVFDPRDNIQGGSRLLRTLANRFRGDMVLTIAGYHAGAGAVQRYGGVPPYETTQAYVRAVLRNFRQYQKGIGRRAEVGGGAPRRSGLK